MCQISPKIPTKLPVGEQICDSQRLKKWLKRLTSKMKGAILLFLIFVQKNRKR